MYPDPVPKTYSAKDGSWQIIWHQIQGIARREQGSDTGYYRLVSGPATSTHMGLSKTRLVISLSFDSFPPLACYLPCSRSMWAILEVVWIPTEKVLPGREVFQRVLLLNVGALFHSSFPTSCSPSLLFPSERITHTISLSLFLFCARFYFLFFFLYHLLHPTFCLSDFIFSVCLYLYFSVRPSLFFFSFCLCGHNFHFFLFSLIICVCLYMCLCLSFSLSHRVAPFLAIDQEWDLNLVCIVNVLWLQ